MNKITSLLVATLTVAACSKSKNDTKKDGNKKTNKAVVQSKYVAYPLNRVGYITELNDTLKDNYFRKSINDFQDKYKYRLDGTEDAAYRMKFSTTRAYSTDSAKEYKLAFERLNQNNVGLTFVENDSIFRKLIEAKSGKTTYNLWKEIMKNEIYKGHIVIIGKDSRFYRNQEDKIGVGKEKWEWKSDKIATFEYSEIISAYYMGYITQYTFGLTKEGTKKTVGYVVAATYEQPHQKTKNIKKAIAFRKGVEDAIKEKATGAATFALKTQTTTDSDGETLVRPATDLEQIIPNLIKSSNYKDKDHSIVYVAGASSVYNELISGFLVEVQANNKNGHKLVGDYGATTAGDLFDASSDTNYVEAKKTNDDDEEVIVKDKSVVGRVVMHYNKDNLAYRNDEYNREVAAKYAIDKVFDSIYNQDNLDIYFGKHTHVGTFPIIYKPGERQVPSDSQPAKSISDEMKKALVDKNLSEDDFKTKSTWLGWDE